MPFQIKYIAIILAINSIYIPKYIAILFALNILYIHLNILKAKVQQYIVEVTHRTRAQMIGVNRITQL